MVSKCRSKWVRILLATYVYAVLYFCSNLRGSHLDRSDAKSMERDFRDRAVKCMRTPHSEQALFGTCSPQADVLGPHQKVVSFSFLGGDKIWSSLRGAEHNARLMALYYPGWRMRVYHSVSQESRWWNSLLGATCWYSHVDLCAVDRLPGVPDNPVLWRVLPAQDPLVDVFVSRDLASRVSDRESAAVTEWLESNATFHVMRDHPGHYHAITGGLWGARLHLLRVHIRKAVEHLFNLEWSLNEEGALGLTVWPLARDRVVQHDAFFCARPGFRAHGGIRPFPTKRVEYGTSNFVGARLDDSPLLDPCPKQCRPLTQPDWITC